MIINCTWAQYNYDIFKLDHQQQQQQSCSPLKFLRLKTYICSLYIYIYFLMGYVPYSSSVTSIREFWEGFQLVWIMFILSLFLGVKFVCVNIYISCFYIFNIGARSPSRSSISEENEVLCMQPCRYNLCFCLYRFALFYKLVSYLLEYIKSIYHRLEMDTLKKL